MVFVAAGGRLLPVHADAEALHHEQDAGDQREQAGDPDREGKAEQKVEAEDEEEEGEKEVGHGRGGYGLRSDPIGEHQHDNNEEHQADTAAGIVTPATAVRPCGQRAKQEQDEYNQEDGSKRHDISFRWRGGAKAPAATVRDWTSRSGSRSFTARCYPLRRDAAMGYWPASAVGGVRPGPA